jgi:hypothetical protein
MMRSAFLTRAALAGALLVGTAAMTIPQNPFAASPAAAQQANKADFKRPAWGEDAKKLFGTWRLVETTSDGKVRPERGANPLGLITYHESGWMAAQIQPDRPPIGMAGKEPSGDEAKAALHGYTAYFGSFTVDEAKKVVVHHRLGSVSPGWEKTPDYVRAYEFEGPDRVVLRPVGNKNALVWERLK